MRSRTLALGSCVLLGLLGCPGDDSGPATTNSSPTSSTGDFTSTEAPDTGIDTDVPETGGPPATSTTSTTSAGPQDSSGGGGACTAGGTAMTSPTMVNDDFGHLLFLWLFASADTMDATGTEEVVVTNEGGNIGLSVMARDMGSGSGHAGVPVVMGTIDEADCSFDVSAEVPYSSDTGDFGMVTAQWTGTATASAVSVTLSLSGGGIPNGPIEYALDFTPM